MPDDETGEAQWEAVSRYCEATRANMHAAMAEVTEGAFWQAPRRDEVKAVVGAAMAAIVEAGALIHAIAPSIAGTAWEDLLLDTLRGAIRGAGHAVDEHGVNRSYPDA